MTISTAKGWAIFIGLSTIATISQAAPPAVPTASSPSYAASNTDYQVTWNSVAGATRYDLIGEKKGIIYSGGGLSSTRNNPAGDYGYRVRACNASGECSAYSNRPATIVMDKPSIPGKPSASPSLVRTGNSVNVSWGASTGDADDYKLYVDGVKKYDGPNTSATITAESYGVKSLNVRACSRQVGCSRWSASGSFKVYDAPGAPSGFVPSASSVNPGSNVTLSWNMPGGAIPSISYTLYVTPPGGAERHEYTGTNLSHTMRLDYTGTYSFRVRGCNEPDLCGGSSYTSVSVNAGQVTFVSAPSYVQSNTNFNVSWGSAQGAGSYKLLRNGSSVATTAANSRAVTQNLPAGNYNYMVQVCTGSNGSGSCQTSAASASVTVANPPALPGNLAIVIENEDRWFTDQDPLIIQPGTVSSDLHVEVELAGSHTKILNNQILGASDRYSLSLANPSDNTRLYPGVPRGEVTAKLRVCRNNASNPGVVCSGWNAGQSIFIAEQINDFSGQGSPLHTLIAVNQPDPRINKFVKKEDNIDDVFINQRPANSHLFYENTADADSFLEVSANEFISTYLIGRSGDTNGKSLFDGFYFYTKHFLPDRMRTAMTRDFMVDPIGWSTLVSTNIAGSKGEKGEYDCHLQRDEAVCAYGDPDKKVKINNARKATKLVPRVAKEAVLRDADDIYLSTETLVQKSLTRQYFDDIFGVKHYNDAGQLSSQRHYFNDGTPWLQAIDAIMQDNGLSNPIYFQISLPSNVDFMEDNAGVGSEQFQRIANFIDEAVEQYSFYKQANPNTVTRFYGFDITREEFCDTDETEDHPNASKYRCKYLGQLHTFYDAVFDYIHTHYSGLTVTGHPYNDFDLPAEVGKGRDPFYGTSSEEAKNEVIRLITGYNKWMFDRLDKVYVQFGAQQRRTFNRRFSLVKDGDSDKAVTSDQHQEPVDREMLQWVMDLLSNNTNFTAEERQKLGYFMEASVDFYKPVAERLILNEKGDPSYQGTWQAHRFSNHVYYSDYLLKNYGSGSSAGAGMQSTFFYDDAAAVFGCLVVIANGTSGNHCEMFRHGVNSAETQEFAKAELDILTHFIRQSQLKRSNPAHQAIQLQTQQWTANNGEVGNPYRLRNPQAGYSDTLTATVNLSDLPSGNKELNVLARVAIPENSWRLLNKAFEKVECTASPVEYSLYNNGFEVTGHVNKPMQFVDFSVPIEVPRGNNKLVAYNPACSNSSGCDSESQAKEGTTTHGVRDRDYWRQLRADLPSSGFNEVRLKANTSSCSVQLVDFDYKNDPESPKTDTNDTTSMFYLKLYRPQVVTK